MPENILKVAIVCDDRISECLKAATKSLAENGKAVRIARASVRDLGRNFAQAAGAAKKGAAQFGNYSAAVAKAGAEGLQAVA